jgi:hypothetical protein
MKNKIDQKLFHSIQTWNFNEDTKQIIIHITSDNIIAEFAYPRNKQSLKIDNYHTRSYHIPSTLIEDFWKLYIHHVTKKINELFRELKKDLRETKDRKEQVQIVVQWQEHINNLTHNLKKENHHQDVLALHIEDRIHRALGLSFFHKDELDTIHTIDRKIKSQIQKLSTITNYIVEDIDHNFEVRLEKKPNNPFRNEKKNHQWEEKYELIYLFSYQTTYETTKDINTIIFEIYFMILLTIQKINMKTQEYFLIVYIKLLTKKRRKEKNKLSNKK